MTRMKRDEVGEAMGRLCEAERARRQAIEDLGRPALGRWLARLS